jgi:hypothetical protein
MSGGGSWNCAILEGVLEIIRAKASARLKAAPPSLTLPHKGKGNKDRPTARKQTHSAKRVHPGDSSDALGEGVGTRGDAHP